MIFLNRLLLVLSFVKAYQHFFSSDNVKAFSQSMSIDIFFS